MKAVVLLGPNEFELQNIPIPVSSAHEVLCKIHAVAICGSDPKFIRGDMKGKWPPSYPFVIGHEWAGEVVAIGSEVKSLVVGNRVAGEAHSGCGICSMCKKGKYNLCENYGNEAMGHRHYGHSSTGSYAQYGIFYERSLTLIPDNVTYSQASIIDAAGTAMHAIDLAGITIGGSVVVIGPGPIGLITAKLAKISGASQIIVVGRGQRLRLARDIVADEIIDFEKEDPIERVKQLTNGKGAHEIFECSGAKGIVNQAVQMARKDGCVSLSGIPPVGELDLIDSRKLVLDQIRIMGTRANPNVSEKLLALVSSGRLFVDDLITHHFKLDEFSTALSTFTERKDGAMKVIIEPNRA